MLACLAQLTTAGHLVMSFACSYMNYTVVVLWQWTIHQSPASVELKICGSVPSFTSSYPGYAVIWLLLALFMVNVETDYPLTCKCL